ncbi:hypothetical protein LINGRAHAP2_LOCUS7936 [Linum grandiflorum]
MPMGDCKYLPEPQKVGWTWGPKKPRLSLGGHVDPCPQSPTDL